MKKCKKVILLESFKKKNAYQFFFDWFEEAWQSNGGKIKKVKYILSWTTRMIISKLGFVISFQLLKSREKTLLVLSAGYPSSFAFPFNYRYEIIPFIWDCWPKYWDRLFKFIKRNDIKVLFVTSRQVKDVIQSRFPHQSVYWLPEGINTKKYNKGAPLVNRKIDLLELGRVMPQFHEKIIHAELQQLKNHLYSQDNKLLFPDFDSLTDGFANSKLTVCYPRCDTHPEMAGTIETLTQRYWECMLSRTLIVGKCPEELIELIGYNPVIDIDLESVALQINGLLDSIASYQNFVDRNYQTALKYADWENRIAIIREILQKLNYTL